jgi:hypothetical protein
MISKLLPLVFFASLLFGCDGGVPPKTASVITNVTNVSTVFPAAYASLPKKIGGACGFDQPKIDGDNHFISGWSAISTKDGTLAEAMVVGISTNGSEKFAVASKQKREDVVKYFKNPALLDSGFSLYVGKAAISSGSKVTLYQVFQGGIYACDVTAAI